MIYANAVPIGKAYYNGWLAEIYMGGTLVWSGYKKIGGEADVEIQLRTTAEGTVAVFVPVSAAPSVQISAAAQGSTAETLAPSAAANIAVSAAPTPDVAAGVSGAGGETLAARTAAAGGSVQGEGSVANQSLGLRLPIVPGDRVALAGGKAGQSLVLSLPVVPGSVSSLLAGVAADSVELTVPDVPGQSVILERQNAGAQVAFSDSAAAGSCSASGGVAETGLEADANVTADQCEAVGSGAETGLAYNAEATASVLGTEIGAASSGLMESCSAEGTSVTGESGTTEEGMALRVQPRGDKWEPPIVSVNLLQIDWVYGMSTKTSQVLGKILEVE